MRNKSGSVAPKERINIVYKPNDAGAKDRLELPMRFMVMGDFSGNEDGAPIEERELTSINNKNFNSVMEKMDLNLNIKVDNHLGSGNDEVLDLDLNFKNIKDFSPDSLVDQVPEISKLLKLRESLVALKGPLGNIPNLRKSIQQKLTDEQEREKLNSALRIEHNKDD